MDIPFLRKPLEKQLKKLSCELHRQWMAFNKELKRGKLAHLAFYHETQELSWRKLDTGGRAVRQREGFLFTVALL
ncbi:hypothetical protein D3C75_1097880 [compost metagenome]